MGMYFRPAYGKHRPSWMLTVKNKSTADYVLAHLLPFLIVKHEQAHKALAFLVDMRAGGLRRTLTLQEKADINANYRQGDTVKQLQKEHRVGYKAIRNAIAGAMRGNRKGGKICRLCGGAKKWSKLRNGQPTLCRTCEVERRRHSAKAA